MESIDEFAQTTTGNRNTQDKIDGGSSPFFVRSQSTERIDTYAYDGEAVLTSGDGVGVGKNFHYINGSFDFHQRVYCIYDFQSHVLGRFFYFYFSEHFGPRVRRVSAKNSVDSVRRSMITDMPVHSRTPPNREHRRLPVLARHPHRRTNSKGRRTLSAQTGPAAAAVSRSRGVMTTIEDIASELRDDAADVQLLYAFNSWGRRDFRSRTRMRPKTRTERTRASTTTHTARISLSGTTTSRMVGADIRLTVLPSSLSRLHADLNELDIHAKLKPYRASFDFRFVMPRRCGEGNRVDFIFPRG